MLSELGLRGPEHSVALVTAGWQEVELEDQVLVGELGVPCTNLRLHARSEELFARDAELATAYKLRQERLRHMQTFYRTRLDYADDAARSIGVRHVEPELLEEEWQVSIDGMRHLDSDHLARCRKVHDAFDAEWQLPMRKSVLRHRKELAEIIASSSALVIAGGHVSSLLNRLRLFDVIAFARDLPIIAWSAGAMVLTDRIVCFHDFPPFGKDIAQVLDSGFGLAPGHVVLPDPKKRLRMDDHHGIGRFARRMAPAEVVAMDVGAELTFEDGVVVRGHAYRVERGGGIDKRWSVDTERGVHL